MGEHYPEYRGLVLQTKTQFRWLVMSCSCAYKSCYCLKSVALDDISSNKYS
jgi:hypothetical protein